MIRAGKLALAISLTLSVLGAEGAFAQMEGPGGIVYGQPTESPPAYVADPGEQSWIDVESAEARLASPFEGFSVRLEYLNWTIDAPGPTLLGSQVLGNGDPSTPFVAADPFGSFIGNAVVPTTAPIQLRHNNGLKLTLGTDLTMGGRWETNAFLLDKADSGFTLFGTLNAQRNQLYDFIATSTNVNGQLANNLFFYNDTFKAYYQSRLWGTGTEYLFDVDREGAFWFQPSVGVRYISLNEALSQYGIFTDVNLLPSPSLQTTIQSNTWNNIVGPQIGFRAELKSKWISIGVDPRIGIAANMQRGRVYVDDFRAEADLPVTTTEQYVGATLFYDVAAYGEIHLTPHLTLRAGYNVLWLNRVTRPENNIVYNDNGPFPTPPDVHVKLTRHSIGIEGLTIGGELKW